jgi:hypothetical protein
MIMRTSARLMSVACVLLCCGSIARAAGEYPLEVVLNAHAQSPTSTVTSTISLVVDRPMEESRRKRVTDGLKYDGYLGFMKVLQTLPPVGTIEVAGRKIEIRYAHEQPRDNGYRLVLVADRPAFFLAADPDKSRKGYELTLVELLVDTTGNITGTMSGAARVKPGPDGGPIIDNFAATPVKLDGRIGSRR